MVMTVATFPVFSSFYRIVVHVEYMLDGCFINCSHAYNEAHNKLAWGPMEYVPEYKERKK